MPGSPKSSTRVPIPMSRAPSTSSAKPIPAPPTFTSPRTSAFPGRVSAVRGRPAGPATSSLSKSIHATAVPSTRCSTTTSCSSRLTPGRAGPTFPAAVPASSPPASRSAVRPRPCWAGQCRSTRAPASSMSAPTRACGFRPAAGIPGSSSASVWATPRSGRWSSTRRRTRSPLAPMAGAATRSGWTPASPTTGPSARCRAARPPGPDPWSWPGPPPSAPPAPTT